MSKLLSKDSAKQVAIIATALVVAPMLAVGVASLRRTVVK